MEIVVLYQPSVEVSVTFSITPLFSWSSIVSLYYLKAQGSLLISLLLISVAQVPADKSVAGKEYSLSMAR